MHALVKILDLLFLEIRAYTSDSRQPKLREATSLAELFCASTTANQQSIEFLHFLSVLDCI
jgi:hypothetical protein